MNNIEHAMLRALAGERNVALAADLGKRLNLTHEDCYLILVRLESAGLVRVFVGGHWKQSSLQRQGWEITDAGQEVVQYAREAA